MFTLEQEDNNAVPSLYVFLIKEDNCLKLKLYKKSVKLDYVNSVTAAAP